MLRILKHTAVCAAGILLFAVLPFVLSGGFARLSGDADAVSSASVLIERPSGSYIVLINRERHKNESDLAAWHEFFSGGDFTIIYDDIGCVTLNGDPGALTLAESFMSRLPENQMKVSVEDASLTLSKAEHGRFDMLIVSSEAAEKYGIADICESGYTDVIYVEDEAL